MLGNRLYYLFKPYLPWRFRMMLRRIRARRLRELHRDIWPVNESAGRAPDGWPGWPLGKKFAFVLTHDVEGPGGLAACRQLMQLEKAAGFRSSFNLIPEGDYSVPDELRAELSSEGFEVGVHDLHHDGKLFQSHRIFSENAKHINHYLKTWSAAGFRAGFMLHELDWMHELEIQYDASTFDTDPFEPQPDAAGTIFPFWVCPSTAPDARYVELPYTLPQDSTLFLVLRETSPEIWIKKLDWIASRGGMALVNVHPDYLRFAGQAASPRKFPAEFYRQFLEYARQKYGESFWQPLPRELAAWYQQTVPCKPSGNTAIQPQDKNEGTRQTSRVLSGKRAAVLLYADVVSDARPRRELEALLDEGMSVDLICLPENSNGPKEEIRGPLRITRIPIRHDRARKAGYFRNYGYFFWRSFVALTLRSMKQPYDLIHVHNMPDALVFAALLPRLRGAKIVLDLHDPMPELCQTIFDAKPDSRMVNLLKRLEKWSIRFAHLVLTPNEAFRALFCARGCPPEKIQIIMNVPDEQIFKPVRSQLNSPAGNPAKSKFRLMYHGLIAERHGLTTAIEAVAKLANDIPEIELNLFGEQNAYLDQVMQAAKGLGLNGRVRYHGMRRLDDIPAAISETDLGIIPNRRTPFTEINFPTRIFEYLSVNKPVVAPDTKGIRDYFDESQILYFKPDSADDLARVIRWVHAHPAETASIVERGREVYQRHLWSQEKNRFVDAVGSLFQ